MSCHRIGHGINSVIEVAIELYDEGKLSWEAMRRIGQQAMRAVNYCDGNEYEAVEALMENRCGRCLKTVENAKELFNVYDISYDLFRSYFDKRKDPTRLKDEPIASPVLCADCFDLIVGYCLDDPELARQERLRIEEQDRKGSWS